MEAEDGIHYWKWWSKHHQSSWKFEMGEARNMRVLSQKEEDGDLECPGNGLVFLGNHCQSARYPAKNDKFFAGERRYSHENTKRLVRISLYPCKIALENWNRKAPRSSWENRWKIRAIDFPKKTDPLMRPKLASLNLHVLDVKNVWKKWTTPPFRLDHFQWGHHGFQLCQFTGNPELERARIISWQWKFPGLNGGF